MKLQSLLVLFVLMTEKTSGVVVHGISLIRDLDVYHLCQNISSNCKAGATFIGPYKVVRRSDGNATVTLAQTGFAISVDANYADGMVYNKTRTFEITKEGFQMQNTNCKHSAGKYFFEKDNFWAVWNTKCRIKDSVDIDNNGSLSFGTKVQLPLKFGVRLTVELKNELQFCKKTIWSTDVTDIFVYEGESITSYDSNDERHDKNTIEKVEWCAVTQLLQVEEIEMLLVIFISMVVLWIFLKTTVDIAMNWVILRITGGLSKKESFIRCFSQNLTNHSVFFNKNSEKLTVDKESQTFDQNEYEYIESGVSTKYDSLAVYR